MMRTLVVAALLWLVPVVAQAANASFPRPASMEHQIRFWRTIFADYGKRQIVVHDTIDLDRIYSVLDFRALAADPSIGPIRLERIEKDAIEQELARLRALFARFAAGVDPATLPADEKRIYDLFARDTDPRKFEVAAGEKRLRTQRGIREKFEHGYRTARRYFPEMERIFRDEGLPTDLTRLPLIESCFNLEAYSKVGAAGIWQFMPSTGKIFALQVDNVVDERRDPILATRAAARFLRDSHQRLGSWPLAITAYNHGPGGLARAVRETGSRDIGHIVRHYDGPAFGFASRNFYAEFLAALDVDKHHEAWFGQVPQWPLDPTRVRALEAPIGFEAAARVARTDRNTLAALNPALMDPILSGARAIPSGYALRIPAAGASGFDERFAEIQAETRVTRVARPAAPPRGEGKTKNARAFATHKVTKGQTLSGIAQRYGVSVTALKSANRMGRSASIRPGQVLRIPSKS
ncbi:MAG: transglycosylase SLT domain-containing protein [bacterium]|nr:transglycosylase SLT domain-containing protein [bacterium]